MFLSIKNLTVMQ